jgi:hypothetical protein
MTGGVLFSHEIALLSKPMLVPAVSGLISP